MATPSLLGRVIELQGHDTKILSIRDWVRSGTGDKGWTMHSNSSLQFRGRVVAPQLEDLRKEILCSCFEVHPCGTKMYHDLRR